VKQRIEQQALELGFDACGFTSAEPPAQGALFQEWLKAGRHGQMDYLTRTEAKRVAPQQVLDGAKSVVVLTASYQRGHRALRALRRLPQNPGGTPETIGCVHRAVAARHSFIVVRGYGPDFGARPGPTRGARIYWQAYESD